MILDVDIEYEKGIYINEYKNENCVWFRHLFNFFVLFCFFLPPDICFSRFQNASPPPPSPTPRFLVTQPLIHRSNEDHRLTYSQGRPRNLGSSHPRKRFGRLSLWLFPAI